MVRTPPLPLLLSFNHILPAGSSSGPAEQPALKYKVDQPTHFPQTTVYPLPNRGNIAAHDPNIIEHNNAFYLFKGGVHLPIFKAPNITGPWTKIGTVLDRPSIINKGNRIRPWAPMTVERDGVFYCFYSISKLGSRESAIGVATTTAGNLGHEGGGRWTDHGALIHTGNGPLSHLHPYSKTNAIDPAFIADQKTGKPYLVYGSYWDDIFQLPLSTDLLSVENKKRPDARQMATLPGRKVKPMEGSFMSFKDPYYYLWFSYGKCCQFENGFPIIGDEYSIRVGRSVNVKGPFVDMNGYRLTNGGGTTIYGSNHGVVYAPGGLGVLTGNSSRRDILYFHYLNTTIGWADKDAQLGWTYLDYVDGWPVANATRFIGSIPPTRPTNYTFNAFILICIWVYVWLYR